MACFCGAMLRAVDRSWRTRSRFIQRFHYVTARWPYYGSPHCSACDSPYGWTRSSEHFGNAFKHRKAALLPSITLTSTDRKPEAWRDSTPCRESRAEVTTSGHRGRLQLGVGWGELISGRLVLPKHVLARRRFTPSRGLRQVSNRQSTRESRMPFRGRAARGNRSDGGDGLLLRAGLIPDRLTACERVAR